MPIISWGSAPRSRSAGETEYPFSVMVKLTIWREGLRKISTRRSQSVPNWGSAFRLSVTEATTRFSMEPSDLSSTSKLILS